MYRNIFYNPHKGTVRLWTWSSDGKRVEYDIPFKPYIYLEAQTVKDAKSIYNTNLQKREFKNQFERKKYVSQCGIKRIFYNIQPEQQFLIDKYGHLNESPDFSKHPLKIFYLDIETYSPDKFPEPILAEDKINVISVYDSLNNRHHVFGLEKDYKSSNSNVVYHKCYTETDLLRRFVEYWSLDYPDIVTGWNCENFDIPYLINRITNILGEDFAKKLSPVNNLYRREGVIKRFGKVEDKWYIKGISHIDYMEAYKVFSRNEREAYSLNYIGEIELGQGKLAYNATSLSKLADTDWQQFIDYNIQDVNIIIKLEEKLQFLQLVRMLAYLGLTSFESALGTISIVTGAMALKAQEKGMIIPTFKIDNPTNYAGGFVKDPKRGMQENIISFDANSLYPNTIITLNLSPETKIGKIISKTDDKVEIKLTNGKNYSLSHKEFTDFVKKENIAISKAKILYSQKTKGFCPELVEKIYNQRVKNKEELKERKRAITHCHKDSEKYLEHKRMINHLDIMQYTLKILMNRLYGTFANTYSPFYDIDAASSITLTGQACVKQSGEILNKHLKDTYGVDEDCVIYMDTDSCYFTIDPVLKKTGHSLLTDGGKISKSTYDIAEKIEQHLNAEIKTWAQNGLNSNDCRFVFKRETICGVGIFLQKKRYILHVLDEEGIPEDKIKYVGVEVASITTPKKVKTLIKNIVETMIKTKDYKQTNDIYKQAYEQFKNLKIQEIAFPKGINDYDKFARKSINFDIVKGTPIHVKSSIYYNQLLDKLNIAGKYEKINSGRKIKYFYAAPNKYNIKSIAFADQYPDEFDIQPDMDKMFDKLVTKAVERLYSVVGWHVRKPNNEMACDLLELLG